MTDLLRLFGIYRYISTLKRKLQITSYNVGTQVHLQFTMSFNAMHLSNHNVARHWAIPKYTADQRCAGSLSMGEGAF